MQLPTSRLTKGIALSSADYASGSFHSKTKSFAWPQQAAMAPHDIWRLDG